MTISSFVARPLVAGMFIYGGLDAFQNPSGKAPRAEKVTPAIADVSPITHSRGRGGLAGASGVATKERRSVGCTQGRSRGSGRGAIGS